MLSSVPTRRNQPIATWEPGDAVSGFALLSRKETRQDRNGRSYLDMELTDASGSIPAKVWADSAALEGEFEAHDFVAFRGTAKLYREALQLSVEDCRRANDDDRRLGFDEALLIPSTREDIDALWQRLTGLFETALARPVLLRLARETLAFHGPALREHPAAKAMHHAYRGGLLEHVVSMAELALLVTRHYGELDRDLVLLGVLFHDLGKLRELGAMPRNDYTVEGRLVGHVVIGRDLLLEQCGKIPGFPEDLRLQLEHLVLSHQGRRDYGAVVEPMTGEALVLHMIDDLDAKLNQLRVAREQGAHLAYLKGLARYVYVGGLMREEIATPPEASSPEPLALVVVGDPEEEARGGPAPGGEGEEDPQAALF